MANASHHHENRFSWGKLIFLGLMTYVLSSVSFLFPLAPIPLAIAVLMYGRRKGAGVVAACVALAYVMGQLALGIPSGLPNVILASTIGFSVAQIVLSKQHPVRGLVLAGLALFAIFLAGLGTVQLTYEGGVYQAVLDAVQQTAQTMQSTEQNKEFLASQHPIAEQMNYVIDNPEETATAITRWMTVAGFVALFMGIWIALFLVLRNSPIWRQKVSYPFQAKDLLEGRMTEVAFWPLIAGLTLYVGGEYFMEAQLAEIVGGNILMALGVFYFFQGIGIYLETLDFFGIYGFLRSIMVVTVLIFAWEVIVLGGVFDMWINFRKWLVKKDEGDKS